MLEYGNRYIRIIISQTTLEISKIINRIRERERDENKWSGEKGSLDNKIK